jgi:hypothetical protein
MVLLQELPPEANTAKSSDNTASFEEVVQRVKSFMPDERM